MQNAHEFGSTLVVILSSGATFFGCLIIFYLIEKRRRRKHQKSIKQLMKGKAKAIVDRHVRNPIIAPSPHNDWEAGGTFNPAAWKDEKGKTHLVYRAVGADGISRLGYAESKDGQNFQSLHYPIYTMENPRFLRGRDAEQRKYDRVMYPSGGSFGGAEDPRMVEIDGRIYVSCSAFDGWDFIRIAIISIDKNDFINKRWKWSNVLLISPEGEVHKNWVLFPEKINGKFAILHTISPQIEIDYVDQLEDLAYGRKKIKSVFSSSIEREGWDKRVRGVGAPPVRTKYGWLLLYHATDKEEPHKYKVGAMMLDINDPSRIIARSPGPLLTPDMWYENEWKAGVVYVCGAVLENGALHIYYGGGDRYVCMAEIAEDHLMEWLMGDKTKDLQKVAELMQK